MIDDEMIDEECGSVSRLAPLFGPTPCAMAVGAAEDPEYARAVGREIGNTIGKTVGGSFGKKIGGNVGASLGRGLIGTLFKN